MYYKRFSPTWRPITDERPGRLTANTATPGQLGFPTVCGAVRPLHLNPRAAAVAAAGANITNSAGQPDFYRQQFTQYGLNFVVPNYPDKS